MSERLTIDTIDPGATKAVLGLERYARNSGLEASLYELSEMHVALALTPPLVNAEWVGWVKIEGDIDHKCTVAITPVRASRANKSASSAAPS